ncbi:hypothetical protein BECAL_02470 [Bellilinea caldifistulae]|uniref:Uncharacterized protein n=1 Tax=Bellilinea caldifistulae TaxID=360411 RepID=A0A0P6WZH6_9CHLR|nr:hypothetical protein [Bellilinea caldifistulae]KPL73971.1 hypothetical protein AC812_14525 [Bellilinea caldifistulae]GAP11284.1 hypothetical protein BECAL_02470 [Bellilinea caldifistulae]
MDDVIIHDPYIDLALAMIYHPVLDLESDNPACVTEARTWFQFVGLNWCELLGVSEEELEAWVAGGFTLPPSTHRN